MIKRLTIIFAFAMALVSCSMNQAKAKSDNTSPNGTSINDSTAMNTPTIPEGSVKVAVETTAGNFTLLLYGDTPGHRDNFVKHVKAGDYDGVLFHRVIKEFMVQGGDPNSKNAEPGQPLGAGDGGEPIPAEILFPAHYHKRGALAAARTGDNINPERKSSAMQFYIVTGKVFSDAELDQLDMRLRRSVGQNYFNQLVQDHIDEVRAMQQAGDREGLNALQQKLSAETNAWIDANPVGMTKEMRQVYSTIGGAPHLDNEYTVYGEVIEGMDVIDKIEHAPTGAMDRPVEDIRVISMKIVE